MKQYEILYCYHFGFGKNHSVAVTHLVNKITSAIDREEITTGALSGLSKAFDTTDHNVLFAILEHYGICSLALKWIKSYFSNRKQFNQTCSQEQRRKCGVPQRSILGPCSLFYALMIFLMSPN